MHLKKGANDLPMLTQNYSLKQQLKISKQQIQLLNFYALNSLEIENRIISELEDNPFLDDVQQEEQTQELKDENFDDDDDAGFDSRAMQNEPREFTQKQVASPVNFREDAKQQLHTLDIDDDLRELAEYLVDTLNDRGLLETPLDELATEISFQKQKWIEPAQLQAARDVLRRIEPVGLGAKDIHECLLIQLEHRAGQSAEAATAKSLIENHYDDLVTHKFDKICRAYGMERHQLTDILHYVSKLDFYPVSGQGSNAEQKNTIIPDFLVTKNDDVIEVTLCSSKADSITVNQGLYEQMKNVSKEKSAKVYVNNKIQSAMWFADALKQRESTMLQIMKAIVKFQPEYFAEGDATKLKPMVLKDIAAITGHDLSTVSRITANRYADTHFGIIYLKDLFGESVKAEDGDAISNKAAQSMIQDIVEAEDKNKPLTDEQIAQALKNQGYKIARRTVTKYRELMNIPAAQMRSMQFAIKY